MKVRSSVVPFVGIVLVASSCGGTDPAPAALSGTATVPAATASTRAGGGAGAVAAGAPHDASAVACTATEQALTVAAETFSALEGRAPSDQQSLVDAGLVREASPWFEITVDGGIVATPSGPCA